MATHDTHKPAATATKVTSPVQRAPESASAESETERTELVAAPQLTARLNGQQHARMMQRMQRTVGNAQVQRMLKAAPVQQRPAINPTKVVSPSTIVPAQRTAVSVTEVQRTSEAAVAVPATNNVQRATTPIMRSGRGWDWNPLNAGRRVLNAASNGAQQLARAGFEQALRTAGVDPGRVMGLINRAGGSIGSIISNPGRFTNTLVSGVRQGFGRFQSNISAHLQAGFSGWLLGATGVTVPRDFSPPSVLSLVLQVLNISSATIRQSVARQVGAGNAARIEQAWGVIGTAMRNGPGGLWPMLQEYLGDLKTVVIDGLKEWVVTTIVRSAIGRIASMFNPASGLVAAIRMIYSVITFLIERAGQIRALFQAVGDSASALAQGNTQQAATKIEQALARSIPVAIGFLASLVGINGVAGKVREIIGRVRSRIQSALDRMIAKVISRFRTVVPPAGRQPTTASNNPTNDQSRLRQGVLAGVAAVNQRSGTRIGAPAINPLLAPLKQRYSLGVLEPVVRNGYWAIHGEIRRMTEGTSKQPLSEEAENQQQGSGRPDLYRSGNTLNSRIDNVRIPKDIEPDSDDFVYPASGGTSSFTRKGPGRNWWKFPASKSPPEGITIRNDHGQHYVWEPSMKMKLSEYIERLRRSFAHWIRVS